MRNKKIQSIILDDNEIDNHTKLGKVIKKSALELLPYFLDRHNCGFLDGGCLLFAESIKEALNKLKIDSELYCVGRKDNLDHMIVKIEHIAFGQVFIDADGLSTEQEMIDKMIFLEQLPTNIVCQPITETIDIPADYGLGEINNRNLITESREYISKIMEKKLKIFFVNKKKNIRKGIKNG